jgi:outer membrane protein TolC
MFVSISKSQIVLTMSDVINIARTENISARKAYVAQQNAFWDYQIHKSNLNPQIRLQTQLADFSQGVTPVSQEDGSIVIQSVNQNSSNASLALIQPIPAIGANLFMNTYLYRFDNFSDHSHSYSSQPLELGVQMPVFSFNSLKWDKKIEPIKFDESNKEYNRDLEISVLTAVDMFFKNIADKHDYNVAQFNMEMNKQLYEVSKEKYQIGQISKDELLQVHYMLVSAQKKLESAQVQMENSKLLLLTHLSITDLSNFELIVPTNIPNIYIKSQKAIEYAIEYNPESLSFKRRILEAEREVARVKGATGINGDVFATIGYGSNFVEINEWNNDLNRNASLRVGLTIPVIDWGRTNANRKKAMMMMELEETSVQQEKIDFEKEIISLVNVVNMLKENMEVVRQADSIATERYQIAYKRYLAGDISILELNMAQREKDFSSQDLLSTRASFWVKYHQLRMISLYDYILDKPLFD